MTRGPAIRSLARAALLAVAALAGPWAAQAQSFCSSDGQRRPVALLERFTSADCESCWGEPAPVPATGELALDWIVPGSKGEDAPLSAAASRDALSRLEALRRGVPAATDVARTPSRSPVRGLRVSHGLAFNGYLGASIEIKPRPVGRWSAWLLLVETIPAGTEGSPIERNLVRNVLGSLPDASHPLSKEEQRRFFEARAMSIPEAANPERLRVVGWVEDGRGRIRGIAQSRCAPASRGG
jgi:hypothetical protein